MAQETEGSATPEKPVELDPAMEPGIAPKPDEEEVAPDDDEDETA